jgi:hypothetical protein
MPGAPTSTDHHDARRAITGREPTNATQQHPLGRTEGAHARHAPATRIVEAGAKRT